MLSDVFTNTSESGPAPDERWRKMPRRLFFLLTIDEEYFSNALSNLSFYNDTKACVTFEKQSDSYTDVVIDFMPNRSIFGCEKCGTRSSYCLQSLAEEFNIAQVRSC